MMQAEYVYTVVYGRQAMVDAIYSSLIHHIGSKQLYNTI